MIGPTPTVGGRGRVAQCRIEAGGVCLRELGAEEDDLGEEEGDVEKDGDAARRAYRPAEPEQPHEPPDRHRGDEEGGTGERRPAPHRPPRHPHRGEVTEDEGEGRPEDEKGDDRGADLHNGRHPARSGRSEPLERAEDAVSGEKEHEEDSDPDDAERTDDTAPKEAEETASDRPRDAEHVVEGYLQVGEDGRARPQGEKHRNDHGEPGPGVSVLDEAHDEIDAVRWKHDDELAPEIIDDTSEEDPGQADGEKKERRQGEERVIGESGRRPRGTIPPELLDSDDDHPENGQAAETLEHEDRA